MQLSLPILVAAGVLALGLLLAVLLLLARVMRMRRALGDFAQAVRESADTKRPLQLPPTAPSALRHAAEDLNKVLTEIFSRASDSTQFLASNRILARELKRINTILDAANEGLLAVDSSNKIILANKGMMPFLLRPPAQALGCSIHECLKTSEAVALLNGHSEESGARGVRSIELAPQAGSEDEYYAVFHAHARWPNDEPAGDLLLFRDISRIKNAQKLQGQFVDSVAHELRTPLTSIRAYVEMLIDDEADNPQLKYDFYNIIYEETYRLSELIDNLLNISMLEGGTAKLDVTPTRMKRLIEDALEVIRPQCEKKEVDLVIDLPDRLPTLNVDKRLLNVAIMNILSNAAKYTPEKGTITITSSSHEEELHLAVRDTGIGISEEELDKIFDKFYRAKGAENIQGSGVGLSTARQIVQMHGGDIRVSSIPGEGSTFVIVLPRSLINTSIGE